MKVIKQEIDPLWPPVYLRTSCKKLVLSQNEWNTCTKNDWPTTRLTTNLPCYHWKNSYDTIWSTKSDKRTITTSRSRKELHTTTAKKKKKATNYIMFTKMILGFNRFLHMYFYCLPQHLHSKADSFTTAWNQHSKITSRSPKSLTKVITTA